MLRKLRHIARAARITVARALRRPGQADATGLTTDATFARIVQARATIAIVAGVALAGWLLAKHPPVESVEAGQIGVRTNQLTGEVVQWFDGAVLVVPGLHEAKVYSLRDRTYRPEQMAQAGGRAPLQSVEGLSLGVDLSVRYALDKNKIARRPPPADLDAEVVAPAVDGVVYKVFARYTVREIFSTKRAEIQLAVENELQARLAAEGVVLRNVVLGKVDLPADYKRGMEGLLAEELQTQVMRYTLELKEKRVKETELEATAQKVKREVQAEAAAREQVIAAKAQEEAMKHVLPFKQRQIEQRQLEAEAEKQSRMKIAEGSAQARRIEAGGEADARRKLAEADAFRMERMGQVATDQMAREGALVTRHPLLIQKTLADKLADKVQVIVAPPGVAGGLLGTTLMGGGATGNQPALRQASARKGEAEQEEQ